MKGLLNSLLWSVLLSALHSRTFFPYRTCCLLRLSRRLIRSLRRVFTRPAPVREPALAEQQQPAETGEQVETSLSMEKREKQLHSTMMDDERPNSSRTPRTSLDTQNTRCQRKQLLGATRMTSLKGKPYAKHAHRSVTTESYSHHRMILKTFPIRIPSWTIDLFHNLASFEITIVHTLCHNHTL